MTPSKGWANRDNLQAQKEKQDQLTNSLPMFIRSARLAANEKQFDDALGQVHFVLNHDANQAEARLLKGQILIVQKQFPAAKTELDRYLQAMPKDTDARRLAELCHNGRPDDVSTLMSIADVFIRQKANSLGPIRLTPHVMNNWPVFRSI